MEQNLLETSYDITKKSKLKKFYESYKVFIYIFFISLIAAIIGFSYYLDKKEKSKILLSENYFKAKIYLINDKRKNAKNLLTDLVYANDNTYSVLSLFFIIDQNLIENETELSQLFDHVINNIKLEKELKNLLIFKRALLNSDFINESDLLVKTKSLLNEETLWKGHALLFLGDYFFHKKEYLKAKDFYIKILSTKNLNNNLYNKAKFQLNLISND